MSPKTIVIFVFLLVSGFVFPQQKNNEVKALIRCDDIGMCHSVNMAFKELVKSGLPLSASVMVVCPWYQEAIDILKEHPEVTAGIHLTLNAEWRNFRWGPVLGKEAVPSLVDSCGFFTPSRGKFKANNPKLEEIEKELRAQIERALMSGAKFSYVDDHMLTVYDKPEYRAIVEKLAKEYKIGIASYFGETEEQNVYYDPISNKTDSLVQKISNLKSDIVNLLVFHIGLDSPEMQAMIDLNVFGPKDMSKHRFAELNALLSDKTKEIIKQKKIKLLTYTDLIKETGLENMKSPVVK